MNLRWFWWWSRLLITLVLVLYLGWRVYGESDAVNLELVQPWRLTVAIGGVLAGILLSTYIWQLVLSVQAHISFVHLLEHYLSALFWGNFLPTTIGGDAVRAISLRNTIGHTVPVINSILMTRIIGLWSMILLANGAALVLVTRIGWQASSLSVFLAIGLLILAAVGSALLFGTPSKSLVDRLSSSWREWYIRLQIYRQRPVQVLRTFIWSLVVQVCSVIVNLAVAQSLGLSIHPMALILCMPLINLVALMPISFGGFGVREGSYMYFLGLFGVRAADAILLAAAVYLFMMCTTGIGCGFSSLMISLMKKKFTPYHENIDL